VLGKAAQSGSPQNRSPYGASLIRHPAKSSSSK